MSDLRLGGRAGVVTGGGRGIGAAICTFLAGAGAEVVVADLDLETAGQTADDIRKSGGKATAAAVPDAELKIYPGMGHDLPPELWGSYIEAIVTNTQRA